MLIDDCLRFHVYPGFYFFNPELITVWYSIIVVFNNWGLLSCIEYRISIPQVFVPQILH